MGGKRDPGKDEWEKGTVTKMALITSHLGPQPLKGIEEELYDLKGPRSWRRGVQMLRSNCGEGSYMENSDPGGEEDRC